MNINLNKKIHTFDSKINDLESKISINFENETYNHSFTKLENSFIIKDENSNSNIYVAKKDNKYFAFMNGEYFYIDELEESLSFGNSAIEVSLDIDILKSPMPGTIVKVLVENGQSVKEGDALIIVEAMKMETTLFAAIDGTVTEVNAKEKDQVDADFVLIIVKKD
jgi:biotin carboxyl carrier protein